MNALLTPQSNQPEPPGNDPARIAIVGCGPRGLQCLDRLHSVTRQLGADRLEIIVFEPAEFPGAGYVYDLCQPPYLRMNYAVEHVDFWKINRPASRTPRRDEPSLLQWLADRYPELADADCYVPRRVAGEYLHNCFQTVCRRLATNARLSLRRESVTGIRRSGTGWNISTSSGSELVDEVVITTGHEGIRPHGDWPTDETSPAAVPAFPVDKNLAVDRIHSGSSVVIRGFGLTAIDVALALTEGRGGIFLETNGMPTYRPSGLEPAFIFLWSRSGRPMLAKPTSKVEPIEQSFWDPFAKMLRRTVSSRGGLSFREQVRSVVFDAAAALLRRAGSECSAHRVEEWYLGWSRYRMDVASARRAMLQSFAVATGRRPIDIPYALGQAWRQLYPMIVRVVGDGGLQAEQWSCYQRFAAEMERIAFGPPAENVGRLLALMRSHIVSCGPELPSDISFDHRVDAVLAAPHQWKADGPVGQLVTDGILQRDSVSGAIRVDRCGRPLKPGGGQVEGLAIFGRSTEGWIIGNDTLSRTLHPHIPRWADSILVGVA